MSEDVGDATDDEGSDEESDVFVYVAEVVMPDADEPILVYMLLYDDGTVILTDEEQTGTLYGEWALEDETLSVSITGDDETDFDEPIELVFEFDEDNALVATEYPVEVFGEDGLIFYPADEGAVTGDGDSATTGEFYVYESDLLTSDETEGIIVSLVLAEDGGARMSYDSMDDEDPVLEYGEWTRDRRGNVVVTIAEDPDGEYDEPYVFTFEEDEDDLSLVLVEESIEFFGETELVLYRVESRRHQRVCASEGAHPPTLIKDRAAWNHRKRRGFLLAADRLRSCGYSHQVGQSQGQDRILTTENCVQLVGCNTGLFSPRRYD